ncbi:MAG TPA: pyridoxamine 5'-phosphate oxidase family protein [Ferruginibacter sp.]|nr:pyridoxamine 5'-phosphate oxidase family protein [Ferruginibacter sp.]
MIGPLTRDEIEEVLSQNVFGHLGCNDGFNTFVYPVSYIYDGKFIISHSQNGSKIEAMRQNKRVCLQVDEIKDFNNWKSVMVLGDFQELKEERQRYEVIKAFVDRNLHLKMNNPLLLSGSREQHTNLFLEGDLRPVFYRVLIDEINGRYETE